MKLRRKLAWQLKVALPLMAIMGVLGSVLARGDVTAREVAAPLLQSPTPTQMSPKITVSPTLVLPNDTIVVTGTGFTTGGVITIVSITIGGVAVPVQKINDGVPVKVDSGGNFGATVIIPVNTTTLSTGSHTLSALDSSIPGRTASTTLTIQSRVLKVDPETSRRRSSVTVTGTGFPVSSTRPGADPSIAIQIQYEITGRDPRNVANTATNVAGEFTASFIVPLEALIPSTNTVRAVIGSTTVSETKIHSVPDREVKITPESGPPGTSLTVTGSNFPAFTAVRSLTIGRVQILPSPVPSTNADGSFTARILAPELEVGTQPVSVEVGDSTALISFRMTSPPPTPVPPKPTTPAGLLAPLGTNLVRVWGFDTTKQAFQLYDPAAPGLSDLTALVQARGYWVRVNQNQTVTLGSSSYDLSAGWNLIGWLG